MFKRAIQLLLTVLFLGTASPLCADVSPDFETVLLPVTGETVVPGAYGSLWKVEFTLLPIGGEVQLAGTVACLSCSPVTHIAPNSVWHDTFASPGDPQGGILYVLRSTSENAWFDLRVRDLSRESTNWGTEVPVVRERDLVTTNLVLVDVPVNSLFRAALRIYDVDDRENTQFHVVITDLLSRTTLAERDFTAQQAPISIGGRPRVPGLVEITDLVAAFPELTSATRVGISVSALQTGTRFWAFVTVANNVTQQVTTITPQM